MKKKQLLALLLGLSYGLTNAQWTTEHVNAIQNSHYVVTNPVNSDYFYGFGKDLLTYNFATATLEIQNYNDVELQFSDGTTSLVSKSPFADAFFTSEQVGYVVNANQILKTTDGGIHWETSLELSPNNNRVISPYFNAIHFTNPQVGYVVGTFNKIFKTTNAGNTWQELSWSSSTAPYISLTEVYFTNALEGFVVGYNVTSIDLVNSGGIRAIVLKTTDGGNTWTEITPLPGIGESNHHYANLKYVSNNAIYLSLINRSYLFPTDLLLFSDDGGLNWTEVSLPGDSQGSSIVMRDMFWFGPDEGLVLGSTQFIGQESKLFKTSDGGANWTEIDIPVWPHIGFNLGHVNGLAMTFRNDNGIIVGSGGTIITTNDRGENWSVVRPPLPDVNAISMIDTDNGYAAGDDGLLLQKSNSVWSILPPITDLLGNAEGIDKVAFDTMDRGVVLSISNTLHKTINQGTDWVPRLMGLDTMVIDVVYDNERIYALCKINNQLRLINQHYTENTWQSATLNTDFNTTDLKGKLQKISDGNDTFYAATNENLYRSTNGGVDWQLLDTAAIGDISNTFYFENTSTGYLVTKTAPLQIWKTTDGGNQWQATTIANEVFNEYIDIAINSITQTENGTLILSASGINTNIILEDFYLVSYNSGNLWSLLDFPYLIEAFPRVSNKIDTIGNSVFIPGYNGSILRLDTVALSVSDPKLSDIDIAFYPNPVINALTVKHPFKRFTTQAV